MAKKKKTATYKGTKFSKQKKGGSTILKIEDDDIGVPHDVVKRKVYSPLFPYKSFKSRADLAKQTIEKGIRLKKSSAP